VIAKQREVNCKFISTTERLSDMSTDLVKKTLTIPEVAAELGIGRSLAYALAAQGNLPVLRLGKRLVVPRERFISWLADGGA